MGRTDNTLSLNLPLKTAPIVSLRALEDGDSDFEYLELSPRASIWKRALSMLRRRRDSGARRASIRGRELLCKFPSHAIEEKEGLQWKRRRWSRWLKGSRACWAFPVLVFVFFGIIHIIIFLMSFVPVFLDDLRNWNRPGLPGSDLSSYSPNFTHGVIPVNCHSHNDYWRRIPLYEALRYGCTGVEADVWLFSNELFVGHNTHSLTRDQTFRSMYVDPLVALLDKQNPGIEFSTNAATTRKNGIFDTKPSQTVVLLVDFKNEGTDIFPVVSSQLSALREKGYLTYYDGKTTIFGPITVVATGNAPFDLITRNTTYRDIFFDAPLDRMYEPAPSSTSSPPKLEPVPVRTSGQGTVGVTSTSVFDATNSFYASVSFKKSIGILWGGRISTSQLELIRGQIRGARARGLKPRYWSTPGWPKSLRNKVWRVLVEEGVEYLNGDDLEALTKGEWRAGRNGN